VIVVARPTRWGNPFTVAGALEVDLASDEADARKFVVECFADWLYKGELSEWWFLNGAEQHAWMREHLHELYGRDLGCWCSLDQPCHGGVLLEAANR